MTNLERTGVEQRIIERGSTQDLTRFRELHSEDMDIPPLSGVDFRLYRIALEEHGGVDGQAARKQTKTLRRMYYTGSEHEKQRIAGVIHATFDGLVGSQRLQLEPVPIPVRQEVVVYRRR